MPDHFCENCRDSGVFPGDSYASWACCLCDAGRLRCTSGSDRPSAYDSYAEDFSEDEVETKDDFVFPDLENLYADVASGTLARATRLRLASCAENDGGDFGELDLHIDVRPATRAVAGHAKPKS